MSKPQLTNTQELDEILHINGAKDYGMKFIDVNKAKQAIIDWHNKQVEAVLDSLKLPLKGYRTHRIGSHSDDWGGESDRPCFCDLEATIEAERAKLKEIE